jgi:hypothetical protein
MSVEEQVGSAAGDEEDQDDAMEFEKEVLQAAQAPRAPAPPAQRGEGGAVAARGSDRSARGKRGRAGAAPKLCIICQCCPVSGNNPFCKVDKREYQALKKDSDTQGRQELFEKARSDPVLFKKILEDYREQCQPTRTTAGWQRPPYNFARMEEIISKRTVLQRGGESVKKDYFDVLEIFAKKRMTQADADVYWRKLAIRTPSKDHASRPGTVHQRFNHAQPGAGHADSSFLLYKVFC